MYIVYSEYDHKNKQNVEMTSTIKYAADKGIDPLAVRCAFQSDKSIDNICVLYITHLSAKETGHITAPIVKK